MALPDAVLPGENAPVGEPVPDGKIPDAPDG